MDSRQTNLTRFPVLYPEKRQFFLEGADIFDFGLSLGRSLMPFYSRRIGLYEGRLDQIDLLLNWRVMSFLVLEFMYENNIGKIPAGNFNKELVSVRTALNISSNLNVSLFVQYDNESNSVGSYSRLRWTFAPLGDLFIVYKHNIQPDLTDRWQQDQNQLIVKLTYGLAL